MSSIDLFSIQKLGEEILIVAEIPINQINNFYQ